MGNIWYFSFYICVVVPSQSEVTQPDSMSGAGRYPLHPQGAHKYMVLPMKERPHPCTTPKDRVGIHSLVVWQADVRHNIPVNSYEMVIVYKLQCQMLSYGLKSEKNERTLAVMS